ncbi:MAG: hypothetical protein FJ279_25005 [Planctomycetes bacterium]|nr:hypothetical protein [Planctomycetota bacterium]MBM4078414.1 hypothetical protein [Planctomycetota bacterium]
MVFTQAEAVRHRLDRYVNALRRAFSADETVIARDLPYDRVRFQRNVPGFRDAATQGIAQDRESYVVFTDGLSEWKINPCLSHENKYVGILVAKYRRPVDVLQARTMPRAGMHVFLVTDDLACAETQRELFAERSGAKYEFETFASIEDYIGWLERELAL